MENNKTNETPRASAQQTSFKKVLFSIILILIPILFFLSFELFLHFINYGGDLDLFVLRQNGAFTEYTLNPNVTKRYFFQKGVKTPIPITQTFSAQKDSLTYRIFCLGASTTQGFPYQPNAAFPAVLDNILTRLFPDRHIEVINCGITALTSFAVLDLTREILKKYEPDLLIVYSGHNEFYGVFGQASRLSLFNNRIILGYFLNLQRSRLFLLLRNIYTSLLSKDLRQEDGRETETLMGFMAKDVGINVRSKVMNQAVRNYEANMREIVAAARRQHTEILLCTLVDNQRDFPPFSSLHDQSFSPQDSLRWAKLVGQAAIHQKDGNLLKAIEFYSQALTIDSTFADTHFQLGRCYDRQQNYAPARKHFRSAKDCDVVRFRAPSLFNVILRNMSSELKVPLADVADSLSRRSHVGIIGNDLVHEHVHPNQLGYFYIAKSIAERMADCGLIQNKWDWSKDLPDSAYMAMSHLTLLDYEIVNYTIFRLTSRWPFPPANNRTYQRIGNERTEQIAVRLIDFGEGNIVQHHLDYGNEFHQKNEFEQAELEYLAAHAIQPMPETVNQLGRLYLRQTEISYRDLKDNELAAQSFQKGVAILKEGLLRWPDDVALNYNLGLLFFMRNDYTEEALAQLLQVLTLEPDHQNALAQVAELYIRRAEFDKAKAHLERALEKHPNDGRLCMFLGLVYNQEKNSVEAERWLKKAVNLGDARASYIFKQLFPQ